MNRVKRLWLHIMLLFVMITGVLVAPVICHAKEEEELAPIYGVEVKDGTYQVEIDSSSSMFRIVKAELTVDNGEMSAVITLSGTGYLKLFMGTREEAANALEEALIPYVEDAEGAYTYTIPVEVLNKEFDCAAFSKRKESWYDRQLVVLADSLPEDAVISKEEEQSEESNDVTLKENKEVEEANKETTEESKEVAEKNNEDTTEENNEADVTTSEVSEENTKTSEQKPVRIQADDGAYTMEVTLSGGSGKATVISPAVINVSNQTATARIEWSSSNYDYMLVNGEKYFPVNTEGNSVFEIPVLALDEEMTVVADTVAMSKAHEIEYTLMFHSKTLKSKSRLDKNTLIRYGLCFVAAAGGGFAGVIVYRKKKKNV